MQRQRLACQDWFDKKNLTGTDALYLKCFNDFASSGLVWTQLPKVKVINLSDNIFSGNVFAYYIRDFLSIDIFKNSFDGYAEMQFPPSTMYANFSHNNFVSVSFKRFNLAYETLKVINLRNNKFSPDAERCFSTFLPTLMTWSSRIMQLWEISPIHFHEKISDAL